ncbi:ATP-binding protein [Desulfatiglans anilini]|uniref:ATP-binding protein n=1 Tax=Desulfatiglans anilini TaxID=90728 RepID=UPI000427AA17|nr:adenylate/guanylate cyclase domain-containing protein [Desulfatiglans anilini]
MKCPECQFENADDARLCTRCGKALPRRCERCGAEVPGEFAYCGRCGAPLGSPASNSRNADRQTSGYTPPFLMEKILRGHYLKEGERKRVSVLFADIANFTGISEQLDPEDVHQIMDGCFEILGKAIHGAGGTINQYTGDGVMALFGAPVAYEDHSRQACRAALAVQRALEPYGRRLEDRHGIVFRMRIGIHTGLVVVAAIGDYLRLDYTALGDTTNLAARLQSLAPPGGILVSERVWESVQPYFRFLDRGFLDVKGKSESVRAFQLLGESEEPEGVSSDMEETPFLDRKKEMELLDASFVEACKGGPRLMLVTGEAGVGKSRLLNVYCRAKETEGVLVLRGGCRPYGETAAFHSLMAAFRGYFRLSGQESEGELERLLDERVSDEAVRRRLRDVVARFWTIQRVEGESETALAGRKRILFREIQAVLVAAAARRPLILFIDNMQWVDGTTREFLTFLAQSREHSPILVICAGRSAPVPWMTMLVRHSIHLAPLSDRDAKDLLVSVLKTRLLEERLTRDLVSKAGGNPLFVVEMGRTLLRRHLMVCGPDRCVLKLPVDAIDIPDNIHGVLAARLDALSGGLKWTVQAASVIGHDFSRGMLKAVGQEGADLDDRLAALEKEGIVERLNRLGDSEDAAFRFIHPMMWEVAYHTLLRRERVHLHRLAGEALENVPAQDPAGRIGKMAYHFYYAGVWDKALTYTLKAGRQARYAYACHEALASLERSLDILRRARFETPPVKTAEIFHWKGRMHYCVGQMEEAHGAFERMRNEAQRTGDRFLETTALFRLGWISFYLHRPRSAEKFLLATIEAGRKGGWPLLVLKARSFLGFVYAVLGRLEKARPLLLKAREDSDREQDLEARAWAAAHLVQYYNWTGDYQAALELNESLAAFNEKIKSPYFRILSLFRSGLIHGALGNLDKSRSSLLSGLKSLEEGDGRFWRPRFMNTLGWVHAEGGELKEALDLNTEAWKDALVTGDPETIYNARINMGENLLQMGDLGAAREILDEVWSELRKPGISYTRWRYKTRLLIGLGELYGRLGEQKEAAGHVAQALRMAKKTGARRHQARALLVRGTLLCGSRRKAAAKSLREALELASKMGAVLLEERIREAMAEKCPAG